MKNSFVIDAVVPVAIGITTPKDKWTVCGRFKLNGDNTPTILIYTHSIDHWMSKNLSHLKRMGAKKIKQNIITLSVRYNDEDCPINIMIIEPPSSFGLFEVLISLPPDIAGMIKDILATDRGLLTTDIWPQYGFLVDDSGMFFKTKDGKKLGVSVPIPDGSTFIDFLEKHYKLKDEIRETLSLLKQGIIDFERECYNVCTRN